MRDIRNGQTDWSREKDIFKCKDKLATSSGTDSWAPGCIGPMGSILCSLRPSEFVFRASDLILPAYRIL